MAKKKVTTAKRTPVNSKARITTKKKVALGESYVCEVCGLAVTVDEECGCAEVCDILCCGKPMKTRKIPVKAKDMDRAKLTEQIIELQERIAGAMARHTPEAWMDMNLTIGQLRVLFFIDFEGSTTTLERLANALGVTRSNVSATVNHLKEQGLVSREKHPEDHRIVLLKITEKGESLIAKLRESRMTRMSGILSNLSLEELSATAQHLFMLAKAVEASVTK